MFRWLAPWFCVATFLVARAARVDFNRDIRPILSDTCFRCHGPDAGSRKAGLRLDQREAALAPLKSGATAIVPGDPRRSALIERLQSADPEEVMPPPEAHKPLTAAQVGLFRQWIEEGAEYAAHWAFIPPVRPAIPAAPAGEIAGPDPIDAFIRVQQAAHGLRPSPEANRPTLIRRWTLDLTGLPPTPEEVRAFVEDREPHAAERVVDRLLASPRFGERMASDWLDVARFADSNGYQVDRDRELWAWRDWVIAAFNRNQPFDAFTVDQIAGDLLPQPTPDQRVATGFHRNHMINEEGGVIPEEFLAEYCADRVETTATVWLGLTFNCARCHDHKYDPVSQRDFYSLLAFFHNVPEQGVGDYGANIRRSTPPFLKLASLEDEARIAGLQATLSNGRASLTNLDTALSADLVEWERRGVPTNPAPSAEVLGALARTRDQRTPDDQQKILEFRRSVSPERVVLVRRLKEIESAIHAADLAIPVTLVMAEMEKPRPTFILRRGAYDQPGEAVSAVTPAALPRFPADLPQNRLGLARWLVSPGHPLTARVTVNRFWQSFFGHGLVRTPGDFGSQGEWPTHPELLDWLATEFVESGWDVKALVRRMVLSATYRQDSRTTAEAVAADPENRWLARGTRFRLSAEAIRDQALALSGLLAGRVGGPSVKPYHPPGLYEQVVAGSSASTYEQDQGESLYRRTLYTYWKRSVPNPSLLLFDMPFRETCTVRRSRTTTPLQALNLLNDPTYVEAARALAQRILREGGETAQARLSAGFRWVTARSPKPAELAVLLSGLRRTESSFRTNPSGAAALINVGESRPDVGLDSAELAAWTLVASTLLNLDETLTRE
jgi:hypothetical protein